MIEFFRVINGSEINAAYINLTDEAGRTRGSLFPPDKTELAIIDSSGRSYRTKKKGNNQLWGGNLNRWFSENDVRAGDRILIRFEPTKTHEGCPAVQMTRESSGLTPRPVSEPIWSPSHQETESEIPLSLERQLE